MCVMQHPKAKMQNTANQACSCSHLAFCILDYGVRVSVCSVAPGKNGVALPLTHASCEFE